MPNTGDTFPDVSPLRQYRLVPRYVTSSTAYCHVMLCDALIALLFIVFPLRYFFPVDSENAAGTLVIDYIDDEPFLPEQPGKPPP